MIQRNLSAFKKAFLLVGAVRTISRCGHRSHRDGCAKNRVGRGEANHVSAAWNRRHRDRKSAGLRNYVSVGCRRAALRIPPQPGVGLRREADSEQKSRVTLPLKGNFRSHIHRDYGAPRTFGRVDGVRRHSQRNNGDFSGRVKEHE